MTTPNRAYFIAKGRSLESILKWYAAFKMAQKAYGDFFEKTGINYAHAQRSGHRFTCEGDAQPKAPGFRPTTGRGFTAPPTNS